MKTHPETLQLLSQLVTFMPQDRVTPEPQLQDAHQLAAVIIPEQLRDLIEQKLTEHSQQHPPTQQALVILHETGVITVEPSYTVHTLKQLQDAVQGYIEAIYPEWLGTRIFDHSLIYCNEEGAYTMQLNPFNLALGFPPHHPISGPIAIQWNYGIDGNGDTVPVG